VNLELVASVFLGSIASGAIPFINAEAIVLAAVLASPADAYAFAAASTLGQMLAKVVLYGLARWLPDRLPERAKKRLDEASERVKNARQGGSTLVFVSALTGLPPFYLVSLAAGVIKMSLVGMVVAGTLGRLIRFVILARFGSFWPAIWRSTSDGPHQNLIVVGGITLVVVSLTLWFLLRRRRRRRRVREAEAPANEKAI